MRRSRRMSRSPTRRSRNITKRTRRSSTPTRSGRSASSLRPQRRREETEPKERTEVLQKHADRWTSSARPCSRKARVRSQSRCKFELPVQTTGEFTRATPDPLLTANPQLSQAALRLTPQEPNSDAVQAGDAFYVLHLSGFDPARPLTLDEARPKIVETLKTRSSARRSPLAQARNREKDSRSDQRRRAGRCRRAASRSAAREGAAVRALRSADAANLRRTSRTATGNAGPAEHQRRRR